MHRHTPVFFEGDRQREKPTLTQNDITQYYSAYLIYFMWKWFTPSKSSDKSLFTNLCQNITKIYLYNLENDYYNLVEQFLPDFKNLKTIQTKMFFF